MSFKRRNYSSFFFLRSFRGKFNKFVFRSFNDDAGKKKLKSRTSSKKLILLIAKFFPSFLSERKIVPLFELFLVILTTERKVWQDLAGDCKHRCFNERKIDRSWKGVQIFLHFSSLLKIVWFLDSNWFRLIQFFLFSSSFNIQKKLLESSLSMFCSLL